VQKALQTAPAAPFERWVLSFGASLELGYWMLVLFWSMTLEFRLSSLGIHDMLDRNRSFRHG